MKKKEIKQSQPTSKADPNSIKLGLENGDFVTLATKKYQQRKPFTPINPLHITSFMPGTIREIYVKSGDEIKIGDKLLILEAMKMRNEILSPLNGIVKQIFVEEGVMVPKNHLLIELEES